MSLVDCFDCVSSVRVSSIIQLYSFKGLILKLLTVSMCSGTLLNEPLQMPQHQASPLISSPVDTNSNSQECSHIHKKFKPFTLRTLSFPLWRLPTTSARKLRSRNPGGDESGDELLPLPLSFNVFRVFCLKRFAMHSPHI